MSEASCHNCYGACCIGPQTMQLALLEELQMRNAGSILQTVAEPEDYDREDVIYPLGFQINEGRGTLNWLVDPDNPHEPLPAGYGRYMLIGACGNLEVLPNGRAVCGIYESRPEVCRDFEESGEKGQVMRETKVEIGRALLPGLKH